MSREFMLYDLRVTVVSIEGESVCGMQVGDYFELTESSRLRLPPGQHFCVYALASVLPFLAARQRELEANDWLARDSLDHLSLTRRSAWCCKLSGGNADCWTATS